MDENTILITDARGRKYITRLSDDEMVDISGLGTIRAALLRESLLTGELNLGEKRLGVMKASMVDILSMIERKAQILTSKDIAMILHFCDIYCGSKVVEGGAGSGALSIALLANVGDMGSVTTYELREEFAGIARRNIRKAGLESRWTLKLGDICKGIEEREIDSVILDIPNPWDCVDFAAHSLNLGGHFCAFVPNANQVENTVRALKEESFSDIRAIETLQRDIIVHERGVRPSFDMLGHTGYLIFARKNRAQAAD